MDFFEELEKMLNEIAKDVQEPVLHDKMLMDEYIYNYAKQVFENSRREQEKVVLLSEKMKTDAGKRTLIETSNHLFSDLIEMENNLKEAEKDYLQSKEKYEKIAKE